MKMREFNRRGSIAREKMAGKVVLSMLLCAAMLLAVPSVFPIPGGMRYVKATESESGNSTYIERTSNRAITDDDRADADKDLLFYMQSLEVRYHLDEKVMESLHKVFDSAVYYIANTEMSLSELWAYVSTVKGNMESAAVAKVTQTTSEFLQVADNW